ncbi:unnamed protein product [Caenorhabditis brenneri]
MSFSVEYLPSEEEILQKNGEEYRSGWHETQFNQRIKRNLDIDDVSQLVRLEVEQWCELEMKITQQNKEEMQRFFVNIHYSGFNNQCGELQYSFKPEESFMKPIKTHLIPGIYLVVVTSYDDLEQPNFNWTIRYSESISISFICSTLSVERASLMQGIVKVAKCIWEKEDGVKVYTWRDENTVLIMVDNHRKDEHVRVSGTIKVFYTDDLDEHDPFKDPCLVPPMSRCLLKHIHLLEDEESEKMEWNFKIDVECTILSSWQSMWTIFVQGSDPDIVAKDVTPLK